jgi:hypothetical protein
VSRTATIWLPVDFDRSQACGTRTVFK